MKEKRYRGFLKAVSWRAMGTIDTFVISFLVTGRANFALSISAFEVFTKITLFYIHERIWNRIDLGRPVQKQPIDYEI
jgi:uncharacterized membrane protein